MISGPKELTQINETTGIRQVLPSVSQMGFDYYIYCYINKENPHAYHAITSENALNWGLHHIRSNYTKYDPVILGGQGSDIFIWNLVKENSDIVKNIMGQRRDYGMKAGVTIPLRNKLNKLTGWFSLSCDSSDKHLNSIIIGDHFYQNILDIHIKAISSSLSTLSGMKYNTAYAIILAEYFNNMSTISEKTGISVQNLYKLYSQLYLYQPLLNHFNISTPYNHVEFFKPLIGIIDLISSTQKSLSKRQNECVKAMAEGLTSKQAAKVIGISQRTYEEYIADVRHIFGCANQKELLSKLYSEGIL